MLTKVGVNMSSITTPHRAEIPEARSQLSGTVEPATPWQVPPRDSARGQRVAKIAAFISVPILVLGIGTAILLNLRGDNHRLHRELVKMTQDRDATVKQLHDVQKRADNLNADLNRQTAVAQHCRTASDGFGRFATLEGQFMSAMSDWMDAPPGSAAEANADQRAQDLANQMEAINLDDLRAEAKLCTGNVTA